MGAALTYARRYGLFTLVGIAGEDDLDAPDLTNPSEAAKNSNSKASGNGGQQTGSGDRVVRDRNGPASATPQSELSAALSASLRDELLREIESLNNADDEAALWAQRRGRAKNTLNAADAEQVEQAFRGRLAAIANEPTNESVIEATLRERRGGHRKRRRRAALVEKSVLALPMVRRIRDRDHVKSVVVCGRRPADAHHLRFAQAPALGRKVSDEFTVPLCRGHHRDRVHPSRAHDALKLVKRFSNEA
jgi:ERF superfamily